MFRCSDVQAFRCSDVQAFRRSGVQAFRRSGVEVLRWEAANTPPLPRVLGPSGGWGHTS